MRFAGHPVSFGAESAADGPRRGPRLPDRSRRSLHRLPIDLHCRLPVEAGSNCASGVGPDSGPRPWPEEAAGEEARKWVQPVVSLPQAEPEAEAQASAAQVPAPVARLRQEDWLGELPVV